LARCKTTPQQQHGHRHNNSTGNFNSAFGQGALGLNIDGVENTALGSGALFGNTGGSDNTAIGFEALNSNTTAGGNTAVGFSALAIDTGVLNTALGYLAGRNATSGSNNVYIGSGAQGIAGESNACYITSIFGQTSASGASVLINADGKLGTITSSRRFKEDIKPMDKASEALLALKPVTFRYKKEIDPAGTSQFGLVAEEVEKIDSDLVVRDKEGKPYSVRYDQVNAMLLNEFLKEHQTVQELKREVAALADVVKEQAAQIQKVSGQVKMNRPAPEVAANTN
jgi:hypothetical protein